MTKRIERKSTTVAEYMALILLIVCATQLYSPMHTHTIECWPQSQREFVRNCLFSIDYKQCAQIKRQSDETKCTLCIRQKNVWHSLAATAGEMKKALMILLVGFFFVSI